MMKKIIYSIGFVLIVLLLATLYFLHPLFNPRIEIPRKESNNQISESEQKIGSETTPAAASSDKEPLDEDRYLKEVESVINKVEILLGQIKNAEDEGSVYINAKADTKIIKEKLTELTVPTQLKDEHLALYLLLADIENYLDDKKKDTWNSINKKLEKIKEEISGF